jgi:hypothetical protein
MASLVQQWFHHTNSRAVAPKGRAGEMRRKLLSLAGSDYEREAIAAVREAAAIRGYSAALAISKTPIGCGTAEAPNP